MTTDAATHEYVPKKGNPYNDPEPSSDYDDAHTTEEIEATYARLYRERLAERGENIDAGDRLTHEEHMAMLGDLRLAHCRKYREMAGHQPLRPGSTLEGKVRAPRAQVATADPSAPTIACAVCAEVKPATKFPTVSGRPGVRELTCRDCKKNGHPGATKK